MCNVTCFILDVMLLSASRPHRKTSVLKMDEAALSVINEIKDEMILYLLSDHCYQVSNIHGIDIRVRFTYSKACIYCSCL